MKKILSLILPVFILASCTFNSNSSNIYTKEEENMKLSIDNQELSVTWESNNSVKALNELLPLNIEMHEYGNFEQVGSIGQSIVSNDKQITTKPGDIVLYSSNQIVVFFGTNTWSYTKLGHINLSNSELNTLLNKSNVTLKIY